MMFPNFRSQSTVEKILENLFPHSSCISHILPRTALDKHLLLHKFITCHTQSLVKLKVPPLFLPIMEGGPKYLQVPNTT